MKKIYQNIPKMACTWLILVLGLVSIPEASGQYVHVTEDVTSGTKAYVERDSILATNHIENDAEMILRAGHKVRFGGYFHAKDGSRMSAAIYDFYASDNLSDEHVDLYWGIDTQCLWDGLRADTLLPEELHGDLVYVEITRDGDEDPIYHEILTDVDLNSGSKLHGELYSFPARDNMTDTYRMSLYAIGSGKPLCEGSYADVGTTLPFRGFDYVTAQEGIHPGEVEINWQTSSDLPTHYRIYCNDTLIAIVNSTETNYTDHYQAGNPNTLVNGIPYNYCVEVFNDRLEKAYPRACATGSTVPLNLVASDQAFPEKVELAWNDASAYADAITITRDGEPLEALSDEAVTSYTDIKPVYGKIHEYGIVLKKEGLTVAAAFDEGSIVANGLMTGRVVTQQGDYALGGVAIQAIATLEGIPDTLNTVTDHTGYFEFTNVYYHEQAAYALTVTLPGHTFVQNVKNITLTREAPQVTGIEFKGHHVFTVGENTNFTFDSLSIQPEAALDRINMTWTYTKPDNADTVYFRVYRDGQRIAFLNDSQGNLNSFADLSGIPGKTHNYEVKAYIKMDAQNVIELAQADSGTYPDMALPQLIATADPTNGTVGLNWAHTSDNFDHFIILRDNKTIASLAPDAITHTDFTGVPGQAHTYALFTQVTRQGKIYQSDTVTADAAYPALNSVALAANNFTANPNGTLHFTFAQAHPDHYNFDGYRIYRDSTLAHILYKGFPREYTDYTGSGGTTYTYKVMAFLENAQVITEGGFTGHTRNYPALAAPTGLTASQHATEGVVTLTWNYTSAYADGFVVYRGQDSVAVLPLEARSYHDAINEAYSPGANYNYTLKAYTVRNGIISYSSPANAIGEPGNATGADFPDMPENFTASNDLHNQVRLQWDYPDYVLARFIIYRNGVMVDTLDTDQRLYYDYTAVQDIKYIYSIMADYEDPQQPGTHHQSQKAFAEGSVTSIYSISGLVTSQGTSFGLPGVAVTASINNIPIAYALTDASGYYRFIAIPEGPITVNVQAPYATTMANNGQAIVQVDGTSLEYTANFTSSLGYEKPADTVAVPIVQPVPDELNTTVAIRWTTRSQNYSGFKVYRGLMELADIKAEEEWLVIDSLGYPGQDYPYSVQAYWTNPQGEYSESEFTGISVTFPHVAPVCALKATPFAARDYLEITWSHPYDRHTYYEVNRNDQLLGVVATGAPLILTDSTGLPRQNYNYTVTAITLREGRLLRSNPVTQLIQFPDVAMPVEIATNIPVNQNHVEITWTYPSELFDGFRILRDDVLIADTLISAPYPEDDTYRYRDYTGEPGTDYLYKVVGYLYKNGTRYESRPDQETETFPAIAPATTLTTTPNADAGTLTLTWNYPTLAEKADVINGYIIQRNGMELINIADPGTLTYTDITGAPEQSYTYTVTAYALRGENESQYASTGININATFPQVPAPTNLIASDGTDANAIEIQWAYTSPINNGFKLYRDNVEIAILPGGARTYTDVFNAQANHTYIVQAFRMVDNISYYSGHSNADDGSNNYNNVGTDSVTAVTNVTATDGGFVNKVQITWEYDDPSGLKRFDIYRDSTLIDNVAANYVLYNDIDAVPGKTHTYQVVAVSNQDAESHRQADTGHRQGNGTLQGSVVTYLEATGVPDITITASAWIEGNRYDYTTITDVNGSYALNQVYYADSAAYTVTAFRSGHDFVEDTLQAALTLQQTTGYVAPFRDRTAYILKGMVAYQNTACALDTVKVTLHTRTNDGSETGQIATKEAYTNAQGIYSFVLNPHDPLLLDYTLEIDTMRITGTNTLPDTTWHDFQPREVVLTKEDITGLTTVRDFADETTYPVELVVQSTCGPIGTNRFDIRVSSVDGCFEQQYRTLDNGKITVNLSPLTYSLQITGIENTSPSTLPIVDYLRVRPTTLGLFALHNDTLRGDPSLLEEGQQAIFTYHQQPRVKIISGFDQFLCNDPTYPAIVQQGALYQLAMAVNEQHGEELCPVNEGFLLIKNAAANEITTDTLWYDPQEITGFQPYTFTAGEPITIAPYILGLVVEYHTENGGYQGEIIQRIIVEGEKAPPGNDIMVSVDEAENGQIKLPLFILRDPPGDQSYSYIEEGKTFSKTVSSSESHSAGAGIKISKEKVFTRVGVTAEISASAGGGSSSSNSFNVSATTKQRIQTAGGIQVAGNQYLKGDQADVIVGTGLSTAYGMVEKIAVDPDGCRIIKNSEVQLAANGLTTEWHYSVFQIEKLIKEYDRQLEELDAGSLQLEGDISNGQKPKEFIETLKYNWEQILKYHRNETVPMCQVCDLDNLPGADQKAVRSTEAYQRFCSLFKDGTNHCDPVKLANFTWTNELMEQYNQLSQFRAALGNQEWYSPEVENFTFDGASGSMNNEVTVANSQSHGYNQKAFFDFQTAIGIKLYKKIEVTNLTLSILTGIQIATEELKVRAEITPTVNYHFEFNSSEEESTGASATVGYALSDDNAGDQFSVTVVKGIDPSHTPYFSLLGGRSSCPPEEGTIWRDVPQLTLEYPDGTPANNTQYDVDPEGAAVFPLKVTNLSQFGEARWFQMYAVENTNTKNASVKLNGNPFTTLDFLMFGQEPIYLELSVEKAAGDVYDYDDITIGFRPLCDQFQVADIKTLEVHFQRPCSPVSLLDDGNRTLQRGGTADGDRWVINKAPNHEREELFFKLVDYDPYSEPLEHISLEYRRAGTNHWINIVTLEKASLQNHFEAFKNVYPNPTYPFVWNITDNPELIDGEYEIRALSFCGGNGENFSNILNGVIDRTSLQVFGQPEPADGVLSPGEAISVTFNEAIDCALFDPASVTLTNISNGDNVAVDASATCSGNQLVVMADHATLATLDGDTLQVSVSSALDVYGNELEEAITWQFVVHYEPVYWLPNTLDIDVFKGETVTLTATLFNTSGSNQEFLLSGHEGLSWLTVSETGGAISPSGLDISLAINTETLDVGTYNQPLTAAITNYQNETLSLQVNVLPERPDWEVDMGLYPDNATVIANFNLDGAGLSADTLDMISVWMGNSLRGVANITKVTDTDYVAYITVAGNTSDDGSALSFRVWDASTGAEYDGHPGQVYTYAKDARYGATMNPVVLTVNSNEDRSRDVPLRAGWNWFSINTEQGDMSVSHVLKSLSPTDGDQLKTLNSTSSYSAITGWESLDGLDSIATEQGYLLFLANADTLRLTGADAPLDNVVLFSGWNLIGYPMQEALPVNDALIITNRNDGDLLKGDKSLAEYNDPRWTGMGQLEPYQSYMLYVNQLGMLSYIEPANFGTVINRDKAEFGVNPGTANDGTTTGEAALSMVRAVDDWSVDPTDFEYNMTFTGAIVPEDGQEVYPGSKVVAFVGEECRGIGELAYIEVLDRYEVSLFVYANTEGEEVTFKIVDEEIAKVYGTANQVSFAANTHHGSFTEPYLFQGGEVLSAPSVLIAHPNPFEKEVTVKFTTEQAGDHQWVLRDEVGTLILSGDVYAVRGVNTLTLDLGRELPAGVYLFSLTGTATHETIKLMKHD